MIKMRNKLTNLAKRREYLIAEAAAQRLMLVQQVEPFRAPLILADRGLSAVSYIKSHPAWAASSGIALFAAGRSSHIGKWLQRGWVAWQVLSRLRTKQ
jgi:hypothetical protein